MIDLLWNPDYTSTASNLTSTTKQSQVVEVLRGMTSLNLLQNPLPSVPDYFPLAKTSLLRYHSSNYITDVFTGRKSLGNGLKWSPDFAQSVAAIWLGQEEALRRAAARPSIPVLHPISGAHHAHPGRGGGFCTLNWLVATQRPSNCHILDIDLDAHYGDGVIAFLEQYEDLSTSTYVFDIFGGEGKHQGWLRRHRRLNVAKVKDWNEYQKYLSFLEEAVLRSLYEMDIYGRGKQLVVVYQAGVDCFESDHVGGIPGVTAERLASRDAQVFSICKQYDLPLVVTLAGGYSPECVNLHVQTVKVLNEIYYA